MPLNSAGTDSPPPAGGGRPDPSGTEQDTQAYRKGQKQKKRKEKKKTVKVECT